MSPQVSELILKKETQHRYAAAEKRLPRLQNSYCQSRIIMMTASCRARCRNGRLFAVTHYYIVQFCIYT